jgi:hypothetical protein
MMTEPPKDHRFSDEGQKAAHPASLDAYPSSDQAKKVVAELTQLIISEKKAVNPKARNKRGKSLAEFQRSVGAFVFEVLKAQSRKQSLGWFGLSLASGAGTNEHVPYRPRKRIADGLTALGLIELDPGRQHLLRIAPGKSKPYVRPGRNTRIRARLKLLEILDGHGLTAKNYEDHFIEDLPKRTIYLKARKVKNGSRDQVGKPMPVVYTPHVRGLESDVQAINRFLNRFVLEGATFRGYKRRFNEGNAEDFNWNKGGRLYAPFQQLRSEVRKKFKIDGEPTTELDVSASYLAVLHGIHNAPFDADRDAYASEVFKNRDVIKAFINQSLGSPKLMTRWSKAWNQKFAEKYGYELTGKYKPKEVRKEVISRHPVLAEWGHLKTTWADLMFIESEAMIHAIKALMNDHEAPSYVVHDSLIVRERDLEAARTAIEAGYKAKCGLVPMVRVKASSEAGAKDLQEETDYD